MTKLNLRFADVDDEKLHHRLKAAAKKARRSQNREILTRLQRTFEAEEREGKPAAASA